MPFSSALASTLTIRRHPARAPVTVPTLVVQVREDSITTPSDVQSIYDRMSSKDKKLFWIEGTTRRFDGYNYFGEHPDLMLDWPTPYQAIDASPGAGPNGLPARRRRSSRELHR